MLTLLFEAVESEPKLLEVPTQFDDGIVRNKVSKALIAGQTLKAWWKSLKDADIRRILNNLRVSVLGGETLKQLLDRLSGKLSSIKSAAKSQILAVANTAVMAATGAMRQMAVAANTVMFDWELWVSVLDSRTTRTCRDLDGQQFPVREGPQPGYHLNCRSDRIPISDGGGEYTIGSYAQWASLQPISFRRYAGEQNFNPKRLRSLSWQDVREREERDEQ
jgi:SPP1 gp7 family putative phage head morphogenesis protein